MAPVSRYPYALWKGDGRSGGSYTSGPWKVVLHTTETSALPGYSNGATAPHITYIAKSREWVQHTSFLTAARALVNGPDPVQTNRDSAIQVEIVCYSNKPLADKSSARTWVGDLTEANLDDIRQFLIWTNATFGVKLEWPGVQALSYAQANKLGFRMSTRKWDSWGGVCGHQHVPDANTHWDPGALDWDTLMTFSEEENMSFLPIVYGDGLGDKEAKKSDVAYMQAKMNRAYDGTDGYVHLKSDGAYGDKTKAMVAWAFGTDGGSFYGNLADDLDWALAVKAAESVAQEPSTFEPKVVVNVTNPEPVVEVTVDGNLV